MKRILGILLATGFAISVAASPIDITVSDGLAIQQVATSGPVSKDYGTTNDDVSSGGQYAWNLDLQGISYDASTQTLTITSGFDFLSGFDNGEEGVGDIFLDIGGTSVAYDYAIDLNQSSTGALANNKYVVRDISTVAQFVNPSYDENAHSAASPYRLGASKGTVISGSTSLTMVSTSSAEMQNPFKSSIDGNVNGYSDMNPQQVKQYTYSFNLSSVGQANLDKGFKVHLTESCGNDLIVGQYTPTSKVPEPSTLSLLGLGIFSLLLYRKRKKG